MWKTPGLLALSLLAAAPAAEAQVSAENGRRVAEGSCARCHVVGDYNPNGGIGSTPSFQLMVNALDDWEARFRTFHARRPHPAVVRIRGFAYPSEDVRPPNAAPIEIELDDIADLTAFAATLRERKP